MFITEGIIPDEMFELRHGTWNMHDFAAAE